VVATPEAVQVARAVARDGGSAEEALARIRAQRPLADKVRVADHVIDNVGTLEELRARTDAVLDAICGALSIPTARYPRP
jgi:dephospho-CoA kinase